MEAVKCHPALVMLVSKSTFAVRDFTADSNSEIFYMRLERSKKKFHCTCSDFKRPTSIASSLTAPKISNRCVHYYAVLWAILSNEELQNEFGCKEIGTSYIMH